MKQNRWPIKYSSLTYIYLIWSIYVSHWPIIPTMMFIHQIILKILIKIKTVKYRTCWLIFTLWSKFGSHCLIIWQVAQRATIAHLSPICQGQISFQKTYKWAMEIRGPKSNLSKLLCLFWLPATLMMSRSKINELAWRHHFPIISLWEIF